jgi:hypothetical protein
VEVTQVAPVTAVASADLSGMDASALEVLLPGGARMFVRETRQVALAARLLCLLQNSTVPAPC